jgi:hypothetical protein
MFLNVIKNPPELWYVGIPMGVKSLPHLVKHLFLDNGLDAFEFTNKSGRATLVTRMTEHGVPKEVGMQKTGHFNASSYSKYDRTLEAQTWAAERCVLENISYAEALELETCEFRISTIKGPGSEANVTEVARASGAESSGVGLKRSIEVEKIASKRGKTRTKDEGKLILKACLWFLGNVLGIH